MNYYNALVYTNYEAVIPYHNLTKPESLVAYCNKYVTWTKIFFYKKPNRKAKKGSYCGFIFADQTTITFK